MREKMRPVGSFQTSYVIHPRAHVYTNKPGINSRLQAPQRVSLVVAPRYPNNHPVRPRNVCPASQFPSIDTPFLRVAGVNIHTVIGTKSPIWAALRVCMAYRTSGMIRTRTMVYPALLRGYGCHRPVRTTPV